MLSFLINKNLSLYYWLKKKIGKKNALIIANSIEDLMLILGREEAPGVNEDGVGDPRQSKS